MNALEQFTTEELKAEISRRYATEKAKREQVTRCDKCKYFAYLKGSHNKQFLCTIDILGKKGKHYRSLPYNKRMCDRFEQRAEEVKIPTLYYSI